MSSMFLFAFVLSTVILTRSPVKEVYKRKHRHMTADDIYIRLHDIVRVSTLCNSTLPYSDYTRISCHVLIRD